MPVGSVLDPTPDVSWISKGQARIAGLHCTEWQWTSHEDDEGHSVCITDDGVLLRERVDGRTVLQARSVKYRKLKPDTFAVPDNYEPSLIPGGPAD